MKRNKMYWMVAAVLVIAIAVVGCGEKATNWVPSLENFARMPYKHVYHVRDLTGSTEFEITMAALDQAFLDRVGEENFSVEVLPLEEPEALPLEREGAGVVVDGNLIQHDDQQTELSDSFHMPTPLFMKVHALSEEEPARFLLRLHHFPEVQLSVVVNAGHYKSLVLRRSGSGSSLARFYHHQW